MKRQTAEYVPKRGVRVRLLMPAERAPASAHVSKLKAFVLTFALIIGVVFAAMWLLAVAL